jgi:TonB family protein
MKHKPELPDEEIRSYMDFDRLVADKQLAVRMNKKYTVVKWSLAAITLTVIVGGALYFFRDEQKPGMAQPQEALPATDKVETPSKTDAKVSEEKEEATVPLRKEDGPEQTEATKPVRVKKNDPKPASSTISSTKVEDVYVQAEPVQGYALLYAYFNDNLVYPPSAVKDSIQGVETISFVVNAEGKAEKVEVKQSLGEAFDKEARRLVAGMPAWKPATLNGKPVPSSIALPITFQIQRIKSKE